MILLLTHSGDGSGDLICSRLKDEVFRLNFDLLEQYKLLYTPDDWEITDPTGRSINRGSCAAAFWWKAFSFSNPDKDKLVIAENKYLFRDLYGSLLLAGKVIGNPPNWHDTRGKITLLSIAKKYFSIPTTVVTMGLVGAEELKGKPTVAKSLSSSLTSDKRALFTTKVEVGTLHPGFLWYLQERVESDWDITVFLCGDRLFSFRRNRALLKGLDWRAEQNFDVDADEWELFDLTPSQQDSLRSLSRELSVDFGRYDFMSNGDTEDIVFLEFNANGQWGFLDYRNKHGVLDAVVDYFRQPLVSRL